MILNFTPQQALWASLRPLLSLGKLLGLVFFLSLPLLLLSSVQSYAQRPFITVWKTDNPGTSGDNQITIPGFGSNYTIGWQKVDNLDITGSEIGSNTHTITFPSSGVYRVYIFSPFHRIAFGGFGDKEKILDVEQWGDIEWTTFSLGFSGCSNLGISAIDAPNLSRVTELSSIFLDAKNMNSNINHWDVSNVTSLNSIFSGAISFNQPLDNWDVSNVVFMSSMFSGAISFNQDIGKWNTTKVKEFSGMFSNAISFDQDISNWDVSNAENMQYMFSETPLFNQDISRWNVSKVKLMTGMFAVANSFNQDISNWDVSNVTNMSAMFFEAPLFNQDIRGYHE